MADERENYCKLLGLNPYKTNAYNDDFIKDTIAKMEEKWNKDLHSPTNDAKLKYTAEENLKLLPDIRATMDSPILKEEEFEKAKDILTRKSTKLKRKAIILPDGRIVIPSRAADDLAGKLQWEQVDGKTLISAMKIPTAPTPRPITDKTSSAFRSINDFGCYSPYEFVNMIIEIPELDLHINKVDPEDDPDVFRQACDAISKRLANIKVDAVPNVNAYIQGIRGIRSNYGDEDLGKLIMFGKCKKAVKPALEQMEEDYDEQFSRAYIDSILATYIDNTDADPELCISFMIDLCVKKTWAANFSNKESGLGQCPHCHAMIFKGLIDKFCPCCGSAVNEVCPCCGTVQTAGNNNCTGCGIELAPALRDAGLRDQEIRKNISSGRISDASTGLELLEDRYPNFSSIEDIKDKIRSRNTQFCNILDRVSDAFTGRNYYDLIRTVDNGVIEFPNLLEKEEVRLRYDESKSKFHEADELCVQAVNADEEGAKELYIRASDICPDHPDAVSKLRNYPPEGPADAEMQSDGDSIDIAYAIPEERRGMTFCIYRNEGSYPEVDQTTKPIAEIDGWTYTDMNTEPGIEYYYRIYSKRWGILSQECAECGPGIVVREVTNAKIEPCDDGLKITYLAPRGCSRVRIWRKESGLGKGEGEEAEILHNDSGVAYDDGLVGGTIYSYLFVSEYDVGEKTLRSFGTTINGMTATLPQPVNDLSVRWDRRHSCYTARWSGPEDTALYYSERNIVGPGDRITAKMLETEMTRIEPLESDDGTFRFQLPDMTVLYVYPIITVGNTNVKGKECTVANLRPFRKVRRTVEGYDCTFRMEWPENVESAVAKIVSKNEDGEDISEELEIGREEYDDSTGFGFKLNGSINTCVTLYAVYLIDGVRRKSIGISTEIFNGRTSRVKYSLDTESVKGDRKKTRVTVNFECPGVSSIPRCVMVMSEEGIPLRRTDGEQIWESDDPIVLLDGSTRTEFVIPKDEADLGKMRLFFPDKKDYNRFRFIHPVFRRK